MSRVRKASQHERRCRGSGRHGRRGHRRTAGRWQSRATAQTHHAARCRWGFVPCARPFRRRGAPFGAFGMFRQRQLPVENSSSVQYLRLRTSPSVRARPLAPAVRQHIGNHPGFTRLHFAQFIERQQGTLCRLAIPPAHSRWPAAVSASNPRHRRRKRPLSSPWSCHRWIHRAGGNPATRSGQAQQRAASAQQTAKTRRERCLHRVRRPAPCHSASVPACAKPPVI